MRLRWTLPQPWRSAAVCALATVFLGGLCVSITPVRFWFERLSYDLPFHFSPSTSMDEVVVVERDEKAYRELGQQYDKLWDRSLYVPVLDRLTKDQARLVVFDISLADPGTAETNAMLASAIRRNGHVVLGVDYRKLPRLKGGEALYPQEVFRKAAAGLGLVLILQDKVDGVVRQLNPGTAALPTLAWEAAKQAGMASDQFETRMKTVRWLNYPPSLEQLRRISFAEVTEQSPGYFSNKCVFIGGSPQVKLEGQQTDEYATPLQRWSGTPEPGVVIQALAFMNLIRGNWLAQLPPMAELSLVLCLGGLAAFLLSLVRPGLGALIAAVTGVIVFAAACGLVFLAQRWFAWTIVVGAEIPFALAWSAIAQTRRLTREEALVTGELERERRAVERVLPPAESDVPTLRSEMKGTDGEPATAQSTSVPTMISTQTQVTGKDWFPPSVPDHTLVRCIGQGAYGQVWLAQDVIGTYHAVKFVYQKTFDSPVPFEREFKGIQHFTPISRMHPGFVNILHVGRNKQGSYFFYIMELGDDEETGQTINPQAYTPKTLSRVIRKQKRLTPPECLSLGLELSAALEFLHNRRLIHRDIKPSNVIFVHGQAKFADVGLVTDIATHREQVTYVGTEGYIAPEGPGTPAADVYSLGKVLYEACMGLDRKRFPDLPISVIERADPLLPRLNEVILKACEFNPRDRYTAAQELYDDLQSLSPK